MNDCLHVVIAAELVDGDNISNITFPDPNSNFNMNSSIFIPASYIQERSVTTGKLSTIILYVVHAIIYIRC